MKWDILFLSALIQDQMIMLTGLDGGFEIIRKDR